MTRKLRVGVIGVGIQGELHVKIYKEHPNVDLIAITDINKARLDEVAGRYGIESSYTNYVEMLKSEDLDLVSVATPDFLHKEPVVEAAERGINIVVEKPLATNVKDAEEMVSVAEKNGVMLYTNFSNRWSPPFALTKEAVDKGTLGSPIYTYARLSDTIYVPTRMIKWASKTNVAFFLMSHTADLVRWIMSDEVVKVTSSAHYGILNSMGINTADYYIATLHFSKGAMATLESAWILPEGSPAIVDFKFELLCSKGAVYIDAQHQSISMVTESRVNYPRYLVAGSILGRVYGACKDSIFHAVDCLIHDKKPLISSRDGLINTIILCAIVESATKGTPVSLTY